MLDVDRFCTLRPALYHLSAGTSWSTIQRHGLLSSSEILRKFRLEAPRVREIETHRLRSFYLLQSDEHGSFTLRDRSTLSYAGLTKALRESCSPDQWIDLLSQRVFFFAQKSSLESLVSAPLNRKLSHVILKVDTRKLFTTYASSIEIADMNTGYTKRKAAVRGPSSFQPPANYVRTGSRQIVEVTVLNSVPTLMPLLQQAVLRKPCGVEELLYSI